MKVNQIDKGLYIRGKFFDRPREQKLRELRELGITLVINLIRREDMDLYQQTEITYEHAPMPDGKLTPDQVANFERLASWAAAQIKNGGKVLIFCNAGRNRSGLLAALTLMALHHVSGYTALGWVRAKRPRAIANGYFERYLREWGMWLKTWEVIPGLHIGGDFHRMSREVKLEELQKRHIEAIINVGPESDSDLEKVGWLSYFYIPLLDDQNVDGPRVFKAVDRALTEWRLGKAVLVHCIVGKNRSGLVVALTLVKLSRWTSDPISGHRAVEMVRKARPGALTNPYFVEFLEGIE